MVLKGEYIGKIVESTITENISLWEGVLVLKVEYIGKIDQSTIIENISLWEVHMYLYIFTFQDHYTLQTGLGEGVFGILDMSRYNIVFACIDWSKSPLAT